MTKTFLLKCWSSNEWYDGGIHTAAVVYDDEMREKFGLLKRARNEACADLKNFPGFHGIGFELSFFEYSPWFLGCPPEEEEYEHLNEAIEEADSAEVTDLKGDFEKGLSEELLLKLEQWVECTEIKVSEDGIYWTTRPKHADNVEITTATLSWSELEI